MRRLTVDLSAYRRDEICRGHQAHAAGAGRKERGSVFSSKANHSVVVQQVAVARVTADMDAGPGGQRVICDAPEWSLCDLGVSAVGVFLRGRLVSSPVRSMDVVAGAVVALVSQHDQ